jgi:hypothetical protein
MKPIKLLPKKSKKGWRLNISLLLSESGKRQCLFSIKGKSGTHRRTTAKDSYDG